MVTPRDPDALAGRRYDLIVIGGGIYGALVALEAVRRGLRPLLLERGDFGAATSYNSLRIVHGGLRYLQSLDLARFRESVGERRWFLRTFPDFVEVLPCLMPLYNAGARRPTVFRAALWANALGSWRRNAGVEPARHLPAGRVVGPARVRELFPGADPSGLAGGAVWYDGFAPNEPLLLMEILRWACAEGAAALNYLEATGLRTAAGRTRGVQARDVLTDRALAYEADVVINAAGPWARRVSAAAGDERTELFAPTLAWNVVFRRPALSDHALAVQPRRSRAHTYFLVPWKGVIFAGTAYAPWTAPVDDPRPTPAMLQAFLADLNAAVPGLDVTEHDIGRVFAGVLPAAGAGTGSLAHRDVIINHGAAGGPRGFFSLSGVKFTTARAVADRVLRGAFPGATPRAAAAFPRPAPAAAPPDRPYAWSPDPDDATWRGEVERLMRTATVEHLADALLRRSTLGDNPERALRLAPEACRVAGWEGETAAAEIQALARAFAGGAGDAALDAPEA